MTTDRIAYGPSTPIICTLASLASSNTAGRSCLAVDNTTDLYTDAMLTIAVTTSATALGNDKACYIYLYGSENGTAFSSSSEIVGTDAAVTFDSPTNLKGPYVLSCPASAQAYRIIIGSVASAFGGVLPRKWGFALMNYTGAALSATEANHQKTYTGVTYTNT